MREFTLGVPQCSGGQIATVSCQEAKLKDSRQACLSQICQSQLQILPNITFEIQNTSKVDYTIPKADMAPQLPNIPSQLPPILIYADLLQDNYFVLVYICKK